jgi:hypothetical protein
MNRVILIVCLAGLALVPTMASAQQASIVLNKQQSDELRRRADNESLLKIQGNRLRARGLTGAQQAAQARADAEAKRKARYRKNHRSAIVAKEHPAPTTKATAKPGK